MTLSSSEKVGARRSGVGGSRRSDVEGLRGVAIGLVVVFHIWFGTVSGGVDAFLFISGFFLIPSLLRSQVDGASVGDSLRRLRRVIARLWFPMAATVAVTVAASWFVFPVTRRAETLIGALWSDLFVENWALGLRGHTYADATTLPSPFQHLWSLAVQAQIFVALIGGVALIGLGLRQLARRRLIAESAVRPALIGVLAAATLGSFGWAIFGGAANQTLNYYNTGARFWEIAAGGLIGLALTGVTVNRWIRQCAGVIGLVMLGITGLVVDGATSFPGPAALLPVGGTALVLVAGAGGDSVVSRALSSRPLVYLGTIAFQLYLWHWPMLILFLMYRAFHGDPVQQVSLVDGLVIVGASLALAAVVDRLFRSDLRIRTVGLRAPAIVVATVTALLFALQAWFAPVPTVSAESIDWSEHPGAAAHRGEPTPGGVEFLPRAAAAKADLPQTAYDQCYNDGQKSADLVICDYGAPRAADRPVLALIGGSHAEHFLPALDGIGKARDFTVETVVMSGCMMGAGPTAHESSQSELCRAWQVNAMQHLLDTRPDAVFTNSTRPAPDHARGDDTPSYYVEVFKKLSAAGIPVVGVRDLPWMKTADGEPRQPADCMSIRYDPISCGTTRAATLNADDPAIKAVGDLPGVQLLDFNDLNCGSVNCPAVVGNVLVYRDSHHYSKTFMLSMEPFIDAALGPALGWYDDQQ